MFSTSFGTFQSRKSCSAYDGQVFRIVVFAMCLAGCGRLAFDEVVARSDAGNGSNGSNGSGTASADAASTGSFGTMQIGISRQNTSNDRVWISKFVLAEPANVQQLVVHFEVTGAQGSSVRGIVYADSNGTPTTLLGTTNVVDAPQMQAAWVPLPFATPLMLSPGTYWLGTQNSNAIGIAYQSSTGASKFSNDAFSDGAAMPYAGGGTTFALQLSVYAEYTR